MTVPRRRSAPDPDTGLTKRETELVEVLAAVHVETGLTANITHDALQALTGEAWAGSLAGLSLRGYVAVVKGDGDAQIGYRLTERGWALHAGVDERLADGQGDTLGPAL